MGSALRLLTSGFCACLLWAAVCLGQGAQTGGIIGVVTDPGRAVVPGATVEIISETTGKADRSITTDADGSFSAPLLPPGNYRIEVTAKNFKKSVINNVAVRIGETTRQDVELTVGAVNEVVNVEAAPSLINPVSPTTGQAVDARTMERLPLANPNILYLLSLSAGTASEPTDVRTAGRGTADINVNGGRTSNNSISLEGVNVNDFNLAHFDTVPLPNPNVLQEFKVATSLYDATLGSKGGGALGLVIKSGSKDFHYDLYWTHRNDALNANEWFRNANGVSKRARLLQNVFGGSASGPVPWAGGFWFFNYQGVRARNGLDPNGSSLSPIIQAFPTNPDGTTSAALLAPAFGLTAAQIDPVAVNILNVRDARYGGTFLVPRSGQGGCRAATSTTASFTCQFSDVAPIEDNQYTISYDRFFRDGKDKITGRWFWDNGSVLKPFGTAGISSGHLAFPRNDIQQNRFLSLSHTHVFNQSMVNELRAGYSRYISAFSPTDPVSLADIGAARGNSDQFPGMYFVAITGLFSIGTGVNDERGTVSNQYNLVNTFSWTAGKHSMRMGGEGVQYQLNRFNNFAVRGALTFGATTGAGNTFTAFQNFLQGRITGIQSAFGDPARNFIATDYAAFFQDDYRVTQRLTLNLGVRWEGMSFGRDKLFRAGVYDPRLAAQGRNPFLIPEQVDLAGFKGTPGVPECALEDCFDGNNWGPRVGFAWDAGGDQKTVVRGGYGIYYQRLSNQNILQNSLSAPFTVQPIDSRATPAALQLANPFAGQPPPSIIATAYIPQATRFAGLRILPGAPAGTTLDVNNPFVGPIFVNEAGERCLNYGGTATNCSINLASFTSAPLDAYTPYTQQWNVSVQRELWNGWAGEVGYVGTHYIGGLGIWDPYQAVVASPSNPVTVRDINGNSYTITANTVANEELRHQIIGLSRKRGSRYSGNIGRARYDSLQMTLLRRFQTGLYFQAAYTLSRTRDNVSGSLATDELNATRAGQNGANIYNDQSNPQQNWARGDFDRPHRLIVSFAYDIPVPNDSFFDNQVFRGWGVSGIVTYQSGLPFSVTDSTSGGIFGTAAGTATFTCASIEQAYTTGRIQDRLNAYLNPACFTTAATAPNGAGAGATIFGTTPRNAFRGPYQQNWDVTVTKRFTWRERHQFQFRTDFFNLFNHPVFRFPSAVNIGTPSTFGRITETAVPARLIQFGLRYNF